MSQPHLVVDTRWTRPDPALIEPFKGAATGNISDAAGRVAGLPIAIKPLTPQDRFCGTALTVETGRTTILGLWAALDHVRPGDVLVLATHDNRERAVIGDLLSGFAFNGGAVAIVTDGVVRDIEGIEAHGKPVFAAGICPVGPLDEGGAAVGVPVTLGRVTIRSGDLIVGDRDGIVAVPQDKLADVALELARIEEMEAGIEAQAKAGAKTPEEAAAVLAAARVTRLED